MHYIIRPEKNPKRSEKNYAEKAKVYGYRGDREHFQQAEKDLLKESDDFRNRLTYYQAFIDIKCILNQKNCVVNDLF
jgi:hypothetical protein